MLRGHAAQLALGAETDLTVVIGDLSPVPACLDLLQGFFDAEPATRLHLQAEALGGPAERLLDGDADLILHHVDRADPRLEAIALAPVRVLPVVAPGFLPDPAQASPEALRDRVQVVIRDTARHTPGRDYYLVEGAPRWTVADQPTKAHIIRRGLGWGHLPEFQIRDDLAAGSLVPLSGPRFPGGQVELAAARVAGRPRGPVAERLWRHLAAHAGAVAAALASC